MKSQSPSSFIVRQRFASGNGASLASSSHPNSISLCWHSSRGLVWGTEDRTLFATHFGCALEDLDKAHSRTLAAVPKDMFQGALSDLKGTIFQKGAIGAAYQIAVATEPTDVVASKSQVSPAKKVKMSSLIDPLDGSEVPTAASGQIDEWYRNYKDIKFGHPLLDKEPTPDQLMAMHTKVVVLKLEPYADFSILTPHGRRMAKNLRHRSWILKQTVRTSRWRCQAQSGS